VVPDAVSLTSWEGPDCCTCRLSPYNSDNQLSKDLTDVCQDCTDDDVVIAIKPQQVLLCLSYVALCHQVRQLFERFAAPVAAAAADARFEHFKGHIWPRLSAGATGGLLLVVPSYFDFVRVR
jgi:hypothetical protein